MTDKDMDALKYLHDQYTAQEIYTFKFYEIGWLGKDIWNMIKWKPIEEREFSLDDVFDYYEGVKDLLDILKLNKGVNKDNG